MPPELDIPPLAAPVAHIWDWFLELHAARGGNGFGPNAIGWREIQAWLDLTGTLARPPEIQAIMAIDRAWLADQAEQQSAKEAQRGAHR